MVSTDFAYSASPAASEGSVSPWLAGAIVFGTIVFNAVLCFMNTRGLPATPGIVMASEGLLIGVAALACLRHLNGTHLSVLALIVLGTVVLSLVRYVDKPSAGFDPKTTRDLIIPVVFFVLGQAMNNIRAADKIVIFSTLVLLAFALFEQFALNAFLNVFHVAKYYVARGTLSATDIALQYSGGLAINATRAGDQSRSLLPFLGTHRVSSLFLEPSTLGNFGALVALWAVVRSRMEGRFYGLTLICGLILLVLSDTRLAALVGALGVVIVLLPPRLTTPAMIAAPFVAVLGLWFFSAWSGPPGLEPDVQGLGLSERLLYSGQVLDTFNIYDWFGLSLPRSQTFDAGYAYIISRASVFGFIALWLVFMKLQGRTSYFSSFRNAIALYFVAQLCISASPFTIKLAGMLWFLLGALSMANAATDKLPSTPIPNRRARETSAAWTVPPQRGVWLQLSSPRPSLS